MTSEQAKTWQAQTTWLVGANFVPSNAVDQLEIWQAETWSPEVIDRELGWAASIGMNCMCVFLHELLWTHDRQELLELPCCAVLCRPIKMKMPSSDNAASRVRLIPMI